MKACKHFKKGNYNTYIEMSENPWNGWLEVYDETGKLFYSSFETGLFWEYIQHLFNNLDCIPDGYTVWDIRELLKQIENEWKKRIRND